jgi:hypothetical protein
MYLFCFGCKDRDKIKQNQAKLAKRNKISQNKTIFNKGFLGHRKPPHLELQHKR